MTQKPDTNSTLSLNLSQEIIEGMVRTQVSGAIAAHLAANGVDFAKLIIDEAVGAKVDRDGKIVPKGHYSNNRDLRSWFDHQVDASIRKMALDTLQVWLTKQQPEIEKAFAKAYDQRRPQILRAMSDGTMKALERGWNFQFKVDLSRADDGES